MGGGGVWAELGGLLGGSEGGWGIWFEGLGVILSRTGESAKQAEELEVWEEEKEEESVEDSEEGSEEDSPGGLFLFFRGGLEGALGFGLAFVLFWWLGLVFPLGLGFGLGWGSWGGGGSRVAGGEWGPGTGRPCCPSPPRASPGRYYGRLDGWPELSAPRVLQLAAGASAVVGR